MPSSPLGEAVTPTPVPTNHRTDRRQELLDRFERATELPLLVLAVAMLPLLVLPLVLELPSSVHSSLVAVDWFIWAAFAFEYVTRLALTRQRWRFMRREWASLLLIALPFLRPLRVVRSTRALRALRLSRLVAVAGRVGQDARRLLVRRKLHYALLVTLVVVVSAAALGLLVEDGHGGAIDSFGDALWWAVSTVTTVGYGDTFPVTPAGRAVAAFLMVTGIALFGVITANLASFMVEDRNDEAEASAEDDRLDEVLRRLAAMEARLTDSTHCKACGQARESVAS